MRVLKKHNTMYDYTITLSIKLDCFNIILYYWRCDGHSPPGFLRSVPSPSLCSAVSLNRRVPLSILASILGSSIGRGALSLPGRVTLRISWSLSPTPRGAPPWVWLLDPAAPLGFLCLALRSILRMGLHASVGGASGSMQSIRCIPSVEVNLSFGEITSSLRSRRVHLRSR